MLTVQIAANFNIFGTLMPAMLKICIGLVQAEVITELIMRVEQSTKTFARTCEMQRGKNVKCTIEQIIASHDRIDCWVKVVRIVTLVVVLALIMASTAVFITNDLGLPTFRRSMYLQDGALVLAWAFLATSIILLVTICVLYYSVKKRSALQISDPGEFHQEMKNLVIIQIIFFVTYFLRFFSDYFVVPTLLDDEALLMCFKQQYYSVCTSYSFIMYYVWTSFLWDFLPLGILFMSHYRNFSRKSNALLSPS